ncbi:phosphomannomutase [Kushneria indalinina]|uniref:Phosphomannomutase n=1 Tax=Kushneria indalinina DSM 14324 TaxID=1122140 RepID=A0A3D9DU72_9GAMM|nr:phosphomannomutase [Kushneria indalinina]REC94292.1 phosphomannomutase [Kushneria indalinina DSM 14324]
MQVNVILENSNVAFGTSGARGLVEQFTDKVCAAFTVAFLTLMRAQEGASKVAIGFDHRPSSPAMAATCTAAARSMGFEVTDYGVLPTPALALQAMADGVPAIMITGSHIPFDRNGIKFYRPQGEITKQDEQAILEVTAELPELDGIIRAPESDEARTRYIARYVEWFEGKPMTGKRVGLYQHSAAGRDLNVQVLEALGADVIVLGRSEQFVPVDTEAVSEEDRIQARQWARDHNLDALLTTDGDGDRPLLADERGEWLRGDILGLLCARELQIQALVVPVSCNTAIEVCAAFDEVTRTRIGSPYVLEGMALLSDRYERVAGFEANGGFLLNTALENGHRRMAALPTRDALLPALTLMVAASHRQQPLSALVAGLPERYTASDRLKAFPVERSRSLITYWESHPQAMCHTLGLKEGISATDVTDGLRVTLENGDIIHLRPSGNAPELRCYAESGSEKKAQEQVAHVLGKLRDMPG